MNGTVKEYDKTKGFGFISGDNGEDYFVHVYGLGPKLRKFGLIQGQKVAFDIDFDMKGDKAINVRPGKQL